MEIWRQLSDLLLFFKLVPNESIAFSKKCRICPLKTHMQLSLCKHANTMLSSSSPTSDLDAAFVHIIDLVIDHPLTTNLDPACCPRPSPTVVNLNQHCHPCRPYPLPQPSSSSLPQSLVSALINIQFTPSTTIAFRCLTSSSNLWNLRTWDQI